MTTDERIEKLHDFFTKEIKLTSDGWTRDYFSNEELLEKSYLRSKYRSINDFVENEKKRLAQDNQDLLNVDGYIGTLQNRLLEYQHFLFDFKVDPRRRFLRYIDPEIKYYYKRVISDKPKKSFYIQADEESSAKLYLKYLTDYHEQQARRYVESKVKTKWLMESMMNNLEYYKEELVSNNNLGRISKIRELIQNRIILIKDRGFSNDTMGPILESFNDLKELSDRIYERINTTQINYYQLAMELKPFVEGDVLPEAWQSVIEKKVIPPGKKCITLKKHGAKANAWRFGEVFGLNRIQLESVFGLELDLGSNRCDRNESAFGRIINKYNSKHK